MLEISAVWCMDVSLESSTLSFILACWGSQPVYPDEECMYFLCVVTPTSAAERVCPVEHKVDFVWHSLTGRMLCRELNFKMPAQLSCRFDLAGHCVCVYCCDFPALFPAYLPCRWSQSPLTRLFLFWEWPQCLGICSCVDQVTQSILFLSAERRLVPSWWFNGNTQQSAQQLCLQNYKSSPRLYLDPTRLCYLGICIQSTQQHVQWHRELFSDRNFESMRWLSWYGSEAAVQSV